MDGARPSRPDRPYRRTYKACIPCRQRKAKCDLGAGPDGLPIGPPCARCRREMRQCVFPEKRAWERSRKRGTLVAGSACGLFPDVDEANVPARPTKSESQGGQLATGMSSDGVKAPLSQGQQLVQYQAASPFPQGWGLSGQQASPQNDRASQVGISPGTGVEGSVRSQNSPGYAYQDRHRSNPNLASSMMRTVVASGNDALNILFEAATAQNHDDIPPTDTSPQIEGSSRPGHLDVKERVTPQPFASPATLESVSRANPPVVISDATQETLNVWGACRFVKMGWFTAREAVTFVDL